MTHRIWDPYKVLHFVARHDDDMFCVGWSGQRETYRCPRSIRHVALEKIHSILEEMETEPPNEISEQLPELAWLSLCGRHLERQQSKVLKKWKKLIRDARKQYETEKLNQHNQRLKVRLEKERDT